MSQTLLHNQHSLWHTRHTAQQTTNLGRSHAVPCAGQHTADSLSQHSTKHNQNVSALGHS
jgi:hypothetical protein